MKKIMVTKLLIAIVVLLLAIGIMISYGLGMISVALHGHRVYHVESDGHAYTVIMYGTSISAVHDPNCPCQHKNLNQKLQDEQANNNHH